MSLLVQDACERHRQLAKEFSSPENKRGYILGFVWFVCLHLQHVEVPGSGTEPGAGTAMLRGSRIVSQVRE